MNDVPVVILWHAERAQLPAIGACRAPRNRNASSYVEILLGELWVQPVATVPSDQFCFFCPAKEDLFRRAVDRVVELEDLINFEGVVHAPVNDWEDHEVHAIH